MKEITVCFFLWVFATKTEKIQKHAVLLLFFFVISSFLRASSLFATYDWKPMGGKYHLS